MDKQQIIDYIMHTPSNTNPAILGQFLDEYSSNEGEYTILTDETIITTASTEGEPAQGTLAYSEHIDDAVIKVTFDDIEYQCELMDSKDGTSMYGGVDTSSGDTDFSEYPFALRSAPSGGSLIATETPGTHSIKIEVPQESGSSEDWSTAEVTFIGQTSLKTIEIPNIVSVPEEVAEFWPTNTLLTAIGTLMGKTTTTLVVPLYKGCCVFQDSTSFNVSGNATKMGEDLAIITGDCTITFTDADNPQD